MKFILLLLLMPTFLMAQYNVPRIQVDTQLVIKEHITIDTTSIPYYHQGAILLDQIRFLRLPTIDSTEDTTTWIGDLYWENKYIYEVHRYELVRLIWENTNNKSFWREEHAGWLECIKPRRLQ